MGSLSKDSVEVANPAAEGTVSQSSVSAKPSSGHLRQDAVSLEVPVKVHGSRVKEVVRGVTPHTEPFEEQTSTMIIFPQGGVVRMSTSVSTGQMLVLTNLKTKQDAICRVVKVRTFTNMQGYVEVEFTHPQPTYWGVHFPGQPAPSPAQPQAVAPPPAPVQQESKTKPAADVSWAPAMPASSPPKTPASDAAKSPVAAPPAKPFTPAQKPESSFIAIGMKEDVAAMADTPAAPPLPDLRDVPVARPVAKALAPVAPATPAAPLAPSAPVAPAAPVASESSAAGFPSLSMTELLGDFEASQAAAAVDSLGEVEKTETPATKAPVPSTAPSPASVPPPTSETAGSFGSLTGGAALDSNAAPAEAFGSRFDSTAKAAATEGAKSSPNFALIAAAIGLLVVVVGGGAFYLRSHSGSSSAPSSTSASVASAPAATSSARAGDVSAPVSQPAPVPPLTVSVPPSSNSAVAPHGNAVAAVNVPASSPKSNAAQPSGTRASNNASNAAVQSLPQPAPQPASVTGNMVAESISAHPVTAQRDSASEIEAPSVDAAPSSENSGGALPLLSSDGPAAPADPVVEVKPSVPVRVGGNVKEPRLITSPQPVYPLMAKQAHIQGDVVIKTTIDPSGNVAHTEIVSGPAMLRGAALEALKRWKYAPSMLNGQPIAVQMMVTIKFRM